MPHLTLTSATVPLSELHPHPSNARRGDVAAIAASLRQHGQYRPIVVNQRDKTILAGNHTYRAAQSIGWEEIAVSYVDVDDDEAARILLIDNRLNDIASYNDDALVELLQELARSAHGLAGTGYDEADLTKLLDRLAIDTGDAETSSGPPPLWGVVVECDTEGEQMDLLGELSGRGMNVRALMQ